MSAGADDNELPSAAARAGQRPGARRARRLSRRARRVTLVIHIVAGVAVIGDVWGLALMHMNALASGSPEIGKAAFRFTTVMVFGGAIPFSLISLVTGLLLAVGGGWGLRQAWIMIKLAIQLAILAIGGIFIAPILQRAPHAAHLASLHRQFLVLLAIQALPLLTATALAIGKPGSRQARRQPRSPSPLGNLVPARHGGSRK